MLSSCDKKLTLALFAVKKTTRDLHMYCSNCGKEINDNAFACIHCGFDARSENNYCNNCGVSTNEKQVICTKCGVSLIKKSGSPVVPIKKHSDAWVRKTTAGVLGLLLGGLGIHKFYHGSWGWGLLYVIFIWTFIPAIIGAVEGILYLVMDEKKYQDKYIYGERRAFKW